MRSVARAPGRPPFGGLLLAAVAAACAGPARPPAPSGPAVPPAPSVPPAVAAAPVDGGAAPAATGAGKSDAEDGARRGPAPAVAPAYRTAASTYAVEPRYVARGARAMVASEQVEASQVGQAILAAGGNAVDAAVATAFSLAVTHPSAGNLGGGGFAVVRTGPGAVLALDFRETAPAAATADMYLGPDGQPTDASLVGHRAVGVPGSVAGLWALHRKLGKLPWRRVVAPAIAQAREGFPVDETLHAKLVRNQARLARFPASAALWLPGGAPAAVGAVIKNPDLAAALERIAAQGRDGFYRGPTAAAVVAEMARGGGLVTAADLAGYQPAWREPVRVTYRGHRLATMPPPSSGGVVVAMAANLLRGVDLGALGWHSAAHVHWLAEVWRRAYAARNELLGDPAFVPEQPVARLTSPAYAEALAATIDPARATPSKATPALLGGVHTTNLVTVDRAGMAVALTTTLNTSFGSAVTVAGAGFLLNNEMDDFTAKPGAPNTFGLVQGAANKIEPGKRMLSSMTPTIVEDAAGRLVMVVGAAGGPRIITAVFQVISNVLDFHLPLAAAVAAPRVHHQHLPDAIAVEPEALDEAAAVDLRGRGHALDFLAAPSLGQVTAILRDGDGWAGSVDRREGGAAVGD